MLRGMAMSDLETLRILTVFFFVMIVIAVFLYKDDKYRAVVMYGIANLSMTCFIGFMVLKALGK